ncbi:MAG: NUDIX hydrolase [Hyphomicrobiales bacterium]
MNDRQLHITRMELLADAEWLRLFRLHYRTKSQVERSWVMATRLPAPRYATGRFEWPDAVIIVAYHVRKSKIVVTREYRVALGDHEYGFPAGLVDAGETVAAAARRELHEETGLQVVRVLREGPPVYSSAGITDESMAMVYVECDGEPSEEASHDSELIDVLFVSPAEASRLCSDASLKFDAKAWLVLSHFAATGRF